MHDKTMGLRSGITCALLIIAGWTGSASAAEWYVNNTAGSDANDGRSPATAFATIGKAIAACRTSDTLVLANTGTAYGESIVLSRLGGTPAYPFVIEGNGAVICGFATLSAERWEKKEGGIWFYPQPRPNMNPYLRFNGQRAPSLRTAENLKPGQYGWTEAGLFLIPEEGKVPADYSIDGTMLSSGLIIYGASYIHCRNLIAEGFSNDGFNIHGDCQGIVCENIEARHNGDDGFSIHEDVSSIVRNGWFHHNDYGIQDVHSGRSSYYGILAEDNRISGVEFHGGIHLLVDAVVRSNAGSQVKITHSPAKHIGLSDSNRAATGLSVLKNVLTAGGTIGLEVDGKGSVVASNCEFRGSATGVLVALEATCHLTACVIHGCRDFELATLSTQVELDHNVYHPGRFMWQQEFGPEQWEAFRHATGQDRESRIAQPVFALNGTLQAPLSDPPPKSAQLRPGLTSPAFTWAPIEPESKE